MQAFSIATAMALMVVLSGCAEREFREPNDAGDLGAVSLPWSDGAGSAADFGEGIPCGAGNVATELPAEALVGNWDYMNSTVNWGDDQIPAATAGQLVMTADGRWDGSRMIGGEHTGVATGPGDWTFDGRNLTLTYDDGTSPEFYDAVLVSEQVHDTGVSFVAMTLERTYEDGSGCTVHLLSRAG